MSRLFKRVAKVTVQHPTDQPNEWFRAIGNQVEITDLRIQFKVEKSLTKDPNSCEITISNLNRWSRAEFQRKPIIVMLHAGYDGELRHVYTGDLRYGASELKAPDWETKMQLGSGDRAYRFARVNKSYRRGVKVYDVARDVATSMGLSLATPNQLPGTGFAIDQFNSGQTLSGFSRDELTRLLAPYGYHWSIQDDRLLILRDEEIVAGEALLISQDTGLIGSPEIGAPDRPGTKKGDTPTLKCKVKLYPEIVPGRQVKIESRALNGVFKVTKVGHSGDTHGDNWETDVEGKSV